MSEKSLPHNENCEKFILGGILLDNNLITQTLGELSGEDFYSPVHKPIYRAMESLAEKSIEINHVTIINELRHLDLFDSVGSVRDVIEILTGLQKGLPKPKKLDYYVRILKDRTTEREKIRTLEVLQNALRSGDKVAQEAAEEALYDISNKSISNVAEHTSLFSTNVLNRIYTKGVIAKPITGLATGILEFDLMTTGLQADDLLVIAARPGVGKTAMCVNMAQFSAIKRGSTVLIFSIEMSKSQLYMRLLAGQARISMQKLKTGFLNAHEWARLVWAQDKIDDSRIIIEDTTSLTPLNMRATIKKTFMTEGKLDLVVVDYMQLMNWSHKVETRQQEVTKIAQELKVLAKNFHIPVVALSQLSRAPETRSANEHRPQLSDLRESGAIEQAADIVAFIYRAEMYGKTPENADFAELIVAKHRNGETGIVPLIYIPEYTRFTNTFDI